MRKLFGYTILTAQEMALQEQLAAQKLVALEERLAVQKERADKAYSEIEFYRKKFEEAQERADHQLDAFMTSTGLPEVTSIGRKEASEREKKAEERWKEREKELGELYGETMNTLYDDAGLELTDELKEASDQMLEELKNASAQK